MLQLFIKRFSSDFILNQVGRTFYCLISNKTVIKCSFYVHISLKSSVVQWFPENADTMTYESIILVGCRITRGGSIWRSITLEPRREKTGLRGFRPGLTQTHLYSHRSRLEAWNFGYKKKRKYTIRVAKTNALISFAVTAKLICAFVFA